MHMNEPKSTYFYFKMEFVPSTRKNALKNSYRQFILDKGKQSRMGQGKGAGMQPIVKAATVPCSYI